MKKIVNFILMCVICSCNVSNKNAADKIEHNKTFNNKGKIPFNEVKDIKREKKDSIINYILANSKIKDNLLEYNFIIGDVASDGDEGIAFYDNNLKLKKIEFNLQSSNRVNRQMYLFDNNEIISFRDSLFLYNEDYSKLEFESSINMNSNFKGNSMFFGDVLLNNIPLKLTK